MGKPRTSPRSGMGIREADATRELAGSPEDAPASPPGKMPFPLCGRNPCLWLSPGLLGTLPFPAEFSSGIGATGCVFLLELWCSLKRPPSLPRLPEAEAEAEAEAEPRAHHRARRAGPELEPGVSRSRSHSRSHSRSQSRKASESRSWSAGPAGTAPSSPPGTGRSTGRGVSSLPGQCGRQRARDPPGRAPPGAEPRSPPCQTWSRPEHAGVPRVWICAHPNDLGTEEKKGTRISSKSIAWALGEEASGDHLARAEVPGAHA